MAEIHGKGLWLDAIVAQVHGKGLWLDAIVAQVHGKCFVGHTKYFPGTCV